MKNFVKKLCNFWEVREVGKFKRKGKILKNCSEN